MKCCILNRYDFNTHKNIVIIILFSLNLIIINYLIIYHFHNYHQCLNLYINYEYILLYYFFLLNINILKCFDLCHRIIEK